MVSMKIYANPASPNCRRVLAVAHQINLPVELIPVGFDDDKIWAEVQAKNPNGKVPTLDDGGFYLYESNAIMQYLAEKKGDTPMFPKNDLKARAEISKWLFWNSCELNPHCETLIWENVLKKWFNAGPADAAQVKEAQDEFRSLAKILDADLAKNKFICGANVTLADFSIAAPLAYAKDAEMPLSEFKNLSRWFADIEATPGWRDSAPKH